MVRVLIDKDDGNLSLEICSNVVSSHESNFIVGTSRSGTVLLCEHFLI